MRRVLFSVFLLAWPISATADFSVAVGRDSAGINFYESNHFADGDDARRAAITACRNAGATGCRIVVTVPTGICGAIADLTGGPNLYGASRPDSANAKSAALSNCHEATGGTCWIIWSNCYRGADERLAAASRTAQEPVQTSSSSTTSSLSIQDVERWLNPILTVILASLLLIWLVWLFSRKQSTSTENPHVSTPERTLENLGSAIAQPISDKQSSPQPFADSGPIKGMQLRMKRGERQSTFGKVIFTLDARIDVSAEHKRLIQKYKLGRSVIYESSNREYYRDKAMSRLDDSTNDTSMFAPAGEQVRGVGKSFWRIGQAAVNMTISALSLKVTIDSLIAGVHVECKDMYELKDAEESIELAAMGLKMQLEEARNFASGEERAIQL